MRKRNPLTELEACGINPNIEDFLHEITVYTRKKKRQRRSSSPVENLSNNNKVSVKTHINMADQETQTLDTNSRACNHEEEINRRVKKEVYILFRRLLEYNEKTFGAFMQKLRYDVEDKRIELQQAEKFLEYLKSRSIN
ncbi:13908_t:CDS:1 [Acaulospora colombiana]|uniref:13908_t:CDS:1 n=1 Tax=Acaulospora colombiana TaxID=27376 RepID=A0ACA9NX51_9GLOM|nr:13908_t:CDS:1 [Acaulospora colombiana]